VSDGLRKTLVRLLSGVSDAKEIRTYLRRFSQLDATRFAVIKVGGAILRDRLEETAAALALLHSVGLTPIVLHGGGPQLDARLAEDGTEIAKHDGLRVTTPTILDAARETFTTLNARFVAALQAQGVAAHGVTQGAFEAERVADEALGLVGTPTAVDVELLREIVGAKAIPVLTCLGVAPGGQLLNMNADVATRLLVHAVEPLKVIFLVDAGGLLDVQGRLIESINLASDYDELMMQEWVHSGMRLKLREIKKLLDDAPPATSVSITTPDKLARELFTHNGAGTMVRRGEPILELTDPAHVDVARLVRLIEAAFERSLVANWWSRLDLAAVYVSESYRAAAVVSRIADMPYLDKFAIHEDARGEGIARTVWSRMTRAFPVLLWRSRADNPINPFYMSECDGSLKCGPWTVFWRGESDLARIAPAVERAAALPRDLRRDA
jgi:acetylglutamate kinase